MTQTVSITPQTKQSYNYFIFPLKIDKYIIHKYMFMNVSK